MTRIVQAIYENGVLRPLEPLSLPEKQLLTIAITEAELAAKDAAETPALSHEEFDRLLDELASGPTLPILPPDFSRADLYADHD